MTSHCSCFIINLQVKAKALIIIITNISKGPELYLKPRRKKNNTKKQSQTKSVEKWSKVR